ncbi:MAG TPA: flagellar hook-associated protein FlgK [Acidimicrobiales bacterium]|nr:flagellar hook-associated protein FlgK [Acidimicrobiales bacterium]
MSTFSSLGTALSALYAQQHGMDLTGQNVANANTDGYSRQRVRLEAMGGVAGPQIFTRSMQPGAGVKVVDFQRIRDAFLEQRALTEQSSTTALQAGQTALSRIELSFSEPGPNGLQSQLSEFWGSWDDLANRPGDVGARSQVVERAQTLVQGFNRAAGDLVSLRNSLTDQLRSRVDEINAQAGRIAELNNSIQSSVQAGLSPNELLDQRDQLINQLSNLVGISTRDGAAGTVDVFVGGSALVRGPNTETLGVTTDAQGNATVMWNRLGVRADLAGGGEAGGLQNAINTTIPTYQSRLDALANQLRDAVNTQHQAGDDLVAGQPTDPFFTGSGAAGLAVNPTIVADPNRVAAAAAGAGALDSANALAMAGLGDGVGSPDAVYRALISDLGADAQRVNRQADIQSQIASQVDAARKAQSSVNLDEEMTNMIAYQHAYDAAAKFMTAVDQTLDTLIHMGVVGR